MDERTLTISSLGDLEQFGLNCLTGEADPMGLRLLFDVSEKGRNNLELYYGFEGIRLARNSNAYVGDDQAVGSMFMSAAAAWEFAVYMCLLERYNVVIPSQQDHHGVFAFTTDTQMGIEYFMKIRSAGELEYRVNLVLAREVEHAG